MEDSRGFILRCNPERLPLQFAITATKPWGPLTIDGPSVGHAKRKARNAMVQIGIRALGGLLSWPDS